jgi:hypothetical protein
LSKSFSAGTASSAAKKANKPEVKSLQLAAAAAKKVCVFFWLFLFLFPVR